jgi:excisionase family DNA binding protein
MAPTTAIPFPSTAVISVTEAGAMLGIGRSAAYSAAARGDLPTIRLGRRIVVPTAALRRLLAIDPTEAVT